MRKNNYFVISNSICYYVKEEPMTPASIFLFYKVNINVVYIQSALAPQQNPKLNSQDLMLLSNPKFQVFPDIPRPSTLFLNFLWSLYMSFYKAVFFWCSREFPQSHAFLFLLLFYLPHTQLIQFCLLALTYFPPVSDKQNFISLSLHHSVIWSLDIFVSLCENILYFSYLEPTDANLSKLLAVILFAISPILLYSMKDSIIQSIFPLLYILNAFVKVQWISLL